MINVATTAFEGPMDLLLRLIEKSEVDIFDIPMAQITAEYLEVIHTIPKEMEEISEFLLLAATLLEIKSRMLLPSKKAEPEEDPREELAQRLLAYKSAQETAAELASRDSVNEGLPRGGDLVTLDAIDRRPHLNVEGVDLSMLRDAFLWCLQRQADRVDHTRAGFGELPREKFSVMGKVVHIARALKAQGRLSLRLLFGSCGSRHEMVVTFLALLELVRRGGIRTSQAETFGDVEVLTC